MTEPTQAMPSGNDDNDTGRREDRSGREGGGESGGGAYKDKQQVRTKPGSFDGGQSQKEYHGSGDLDDGNSNPNAVTDLGEYALFGRILPSEA